MNQRIQDRLDYYRQALQLAEGSLERAYYQAKIDYWTKVSREVL